MKASQIIKQVEAHCGEKITPRRVRFHIIESMQREIDQRINLTARINEVIDGADTFNPETHKAIRRSNGIR